MTQPRDPLSTAILLGLVRASPILLLGGLYFYAREALAARFGFLDWFAPPVFLISAGFIVARTVVRRRHLLPTRRSETAVEDEAPTFDADAALQRYLERRGEPVGVESPSQTVVPRPVFGRKVSS